MSGSLLDPRGFTLAGELACALAFAYAAAAAFFPARMARSAQRTPILITLAALILASPLLIAPGEALLRLLAALNSTALVAKLYDLHVDPGRLARRSFAQFLLYLPNWFDLVPRKNAHCRPDNGRRELRRVAAGLPLLVASVALAAGVFQVDWRSSAFLLEHAAKVTAVYLVVAHAGVVGAASWRLVGSAACEPMAHPQCAATPAQFWRRWNQPAQQFFYTDVFLRLGGLRSPLRGTLLTFFVAGLIHEYVFGIAAGRVDGYQTAFFVLHGAVVAATMRLRPSGCWRLVGTAGTLAFVLVSSVLFFRSVENLVAFYACSPASLWDCGRR